MQTLNREICNMIEDQENLSFNSVAEFIGCTKQEMSHFKEGGGMGFRKLLRLSYLLFPKTQQEAMRGWCLELNSTEAIKQSFEYASITRDKELLKILIDGNKKEKGAIGKYVEVYSVLYKFYTNEIGAKDLIEAIENIGPLNNEVFILGEIIKCYNYYYLEKYHLMLEVAQEAERQIYKLGERRLFFKECYLHRIAEILGNVSLYLNDKDSARYYSYIIINADICPKTVSDAYYLVGMTYLVEDSCKCLEHLNTRYEITKTLGEVDIEDNARRDLDFAKLYLNVKLDEDSDSAFIKMQENKGTEFELKLISEAIYQQGDDDFLTLLGAMAHNSTSKLHECRKLFGEKMNLFFVSLAALEIKKMGDNHILIEEAINNKQKTKGDVEFEKNYIKCFNRYNRNRRSNIA